MASSAAVCLALLSFATLTGCESREDRAFREVVVPVLQQAASLDRAPRESGPRSVETRDAWIAGFRKSVSSLPPPRKRDHRYLALTLVRVAQAKESESEALKDVTRRLDMATVRIGNGEDPDTAWVNVAWAELDASKRKLADAYLSAAVAERLALRTSHIWDRLEAGMVLDRLNESLSSVSDWDSLHATKSALARREIRQLR
jgi:hypothetical protein